jgi:hypothetical protein
VESRRSELFALRLSLLAWLYVIGCAASEPIDLPGTGVTGSAGTSGAAGTTGSAGTTGAAGIPGTAGTGSGAAGAAGTTTAGTAGITGGAGGGGTTGSAGATGVAGRGGTTGAGGRGGTTGAAGRGGTTGTAGTGAATATFTQVYASVISMYCFGSGCHNPTGGGRPDFSTKASCYSYFKGQGQLYPGMDPQKSYIYSIMHGDPTASPPSPPYMPPDPNPKVAADGLAIVAAWIAGGALNN